MSKLSVTLIAVPRLFLFHPPFLHPWLWTWWTKNTFESLSDLESFLPPTPRPMSDNWVCWHGFTCERAIHFLNGSSRPYFIGFDGPFCMFKISERKPSTDKYLVTILAYFPKVSTSFYQRATNLKNVTTLDGLTVLSVPSSVPPSAKWPQKKRKPVPPWLVSRLTGWW